LQCKVLETGCRYAVTFVSLLFEFKDIIAGKERGIIVGKK